MTKEEWANSFNKLCSLYQKDPQKMQDTGKLYYENSSGGISTLGMVSEFEFELILDQLKENMIKPLYGAIPQYSQLLEIYTDIVRPEKIYNEKINQTEIETCNLCDDTGFVMVKDLEKNNNIAFGCICNKGDHIIESAFKRKDYKVDIISYAKIKHNSRFILCEHVDKEIEILAKDHVERKKREYFTPERITENKKRIQEIVSAL